MWPIKNWEDYPDKSVSFNSKRRAIMNSKTSAPPLVNGLVTFAALAIILLAMQAASDILAPLILAFVLAICTTPFLNWLTKRGLSGGLALIIVIVFDVIILLGLVWLIGRSVQDFTSTISQYEQRFAEIEQSLSGVLGNLGVNPEDLAESPELTDTKELLGTVAEFVGGIASGISNWVLIIMAGVFFLVEALIMPKKVESIESTVQGEDRDIPRILNLTKGLRQYMVINAGVGALAGVLNTILLFVMGVEFAVLWGILSFFFSFVPNIGFLISVIPPAFLALVQFGFTEMLIVVGAYIVINFLVDNVIKPRFIEEGVNISASVTFLSLVIWGWVLGPIGAILAVPMSIIMQAVLASRDETRWLAYLMGSGQEPYNPEEDLGGEALESEAA
jgi:predicted PurR-regulated permease PerM